MIEFPCLCGEPFNLPDQLAGTSFQCKACGRLVSVPTLDDLRLLRADGTYDVDASVPAPKARVAMPMLPTDSGFTPQEEVEAIPLDEFEIEPALKPRYDPFTGELVRAVEVQESVPTEVTKAAPRTQPLNKSKNRGKSELPPKNSWLMVLGELFMARNVTVMVLQWILYLFVAFVFYLGSQTLAGMVLYPLPVVALIVAVGHMSLIVQETGFGEREELPTPTRNFEFRYDLWDPLLHFVVSAAYCFLPAFIIGYEVGDNPKGNSAFLAAAGVGVFFFPAVLLTASVDGVIANFRPDRVIGVIWVAGVDYIPIFIGALLGTAMMVDGELGVYGSVISMYARIGEYQRPAWLLGGGASTILVAGGVYFTSYVCWLTGHMWRKHHEKFPWVAQTFTKPKPLPRNPMRSSKI